GYARATRAPPRVVPGTKFRTPSRMRYGERTMGRIGGAGLLWLAAMLPGGVLPQATTTEWPTGIGCANIARTEGALLAGPFAQNDGRMALLAWHNGVLFSVPEQPSSVPGSNNQVRMWNLSDPTQPRMIVSTPPANAAGSLGLTPQPIDAHGYLHLGQNM